MKNYLIIEFKQYLNVFQQTYDVIVNLNVIMLYRDRPSLKLKGIQGPSIWDISGLMNKTLFYMCM